MSPLCDTRIASGSAAIEGSEVCRVKNAGAACPRLNLATLCYIIVTFGERFFNPIPE
jgi:hypothetical protein